MQPKSRKTTGRLLTGLTWILIALHVTPIVWMVYCGLKDNQEILSGKVLPGRRKNDIVFLKELDGAYLAGTADGGITRLGKSRLEKLGHLDLGTFATGFLLDPGTGNASGNGSHTLWVLSSNRGLQEVDADKLSVRHTYGIKEIAKAYGDAWQTLWVNEVAGSSVYRSGDSLFLSFRIKGYPGVTVFDLAERRFGALPGFSGKASGEVRLVTGVPGSSAGPGGSAGSDGLEALMVLTNQGIFTPPAKSWRAGKLPAVPDRLCVLDAHRLLLSADSRAFIFDTQTDSVTAWLDRKEGSGSITAFARSPGRIWLGDSRGATSIPDTGMQPGMTATRAMSPATSAASSVAMSPATSAASSVAVAAAPIAFTPDFGSGSAPGGNGDMTSLRITAILPLASGGVLLGGPGGSLSLSAASGRPLASALAPTPSLYIHWRNYVDLWRNIDFGLYLKNSFIVCIGVMLVAMVLASMGGYALARYNFPGKNMFGYSVLATQMVPGIMLLLPLYLMFINFSRATGLIVKGTYGGLILTYAAYFVPFSIWILRGFFASLPKELEEAALVDGCGPIQAFFRIIVPSALPGIIATGVYVFLSAWDELMFAWVLTDEKTYTIPVGIRLFVGNFQNRYDLMMAAATVSTIPVMILFFLMQKHIVSGLTAGAVKE